MRLKKGRWEYELPADTHEVLWSYLRNGRCDFALQLVRPIDIREMREQARRKNGVEVLGYVAYVAMEARESGVFLLTFPTPHKANNLKLRATRIVEL